jgi:hypothetical protein
LYKKVANALGKYSETWLRLVLDICSIDVFVTLARMISVVHREHVREIP